MSATRSDPATRRLARRIVRRLFTYTDADTGARAYRLAMMVKHPDGGERQLGGWCERAAVDQVEQVLRRSKCR